MVFIPAPSDIPLFKDQARDIFMSRLTLGIDCNRASLLDDSAAAGFECVFVGV